MLAAASLILALGAGACAPWPGQATGGLAERQPVQSAAVLSLEQRYEALMRRGGERYAASLVVDARNLLNRARRELAAGLLEDADTTLYTAELVISRAEDHVERSPGAGKRRGSEG